MRKSKKAHNEAIGFDGHIVFFRDTLTRNNTGEVLAAFYAWINQQKSPEVVLNFSKLNKIDSAGVAGVYHIQKILERKKISTRNEAVSENVQQKIDLFSPQQETASEESQNTGFFERLGQKWYHRFSHYIMSYIRMTADILYWSVVDLFGKKQFRKGEVIKQANQFGVSAVPIVMAMSFIIGLVLALQSAAQLRNFGANVYIVDLIVIAMMSEMGPLITAILVAGRSGSAIAAEIATMNVTSELDALKTMGINPLRFISVPKMYGGLLTIPFLTILASAAGIVGGLTTAYFYLDVTPEIFYARMGNALYNKDIITGIVKSIVFAVLIVLTGSYYGLLAERGAEGVGKVTTSSVVASIALVIIADSIMSLVFY